MILVDEERMKEYTERGWWSTETIYDYFIKNVEMAPDKEAIVDPINRKDICSGDVKRLTFAEINEQVNRLAAILVKHGVRKDDILVVQLPNVVEIVIAYLAILKIGAIASPFPVQYRQHEYEELVNFVEAKAIITIDKIGAYEATKSFASMLDKLPTVEVIFTWGTHRAESVVMIEEQEMNEEDELFLQQYVQSTNRTANDIFTICWTSGTEASPKGVPRSHNEWFISAYASVDTAEFTRDDTLLNTFPMVNMAGIGGIFVPWLLTGCKIIMHHPFDLMVFLEQINQEKATYTLAPPPLLNMLLQNEHILEQANISSLRAIGSGSSPLSPWMVKGWKEKYDIEIINYFGSNEGATFLSGPKDIPDSTMRAQYFPRFGVEGFEWKTRIANRFTSRLVDPDTEEVITEPNRPGEMCIKGASIFNGYWNSETLNQRAFDRDGFFKTGDLFEIVEENGIMKYYRFVGRLKDVIIRGGVNISPEEVENLLLSHPKVAEVAVVGYPDEIMGERACAFIVLKDENNPITQEEMISFFNQHKYAPYKIPEAIRTINMLPRNPVGKVVKGELRTKLVKENVGKKS